MPLCGSRLPSCKLSICIATLNRARFIGETLASILVQVTAECEVVVVDGASTDDTETVVTAFARRFECLRYIRQDKNNGIDRDYDRAVELARGEYCWLMTDDDLLKNGAIPIVLGRLTDGVSLLVMNSEIRDRTLSSLLRDRCLSFDSDRVYGTEEFDRLFVDVCDALQYIGSVVIKRTVWISRERESYYGSLFIHIGVIFQARLPGETIVIADPLIVYRMGNDHAFGQRQFEIRMVNFPSLIWSLPLCESAKSTVSCAEPWRSIEELTLWRGLGSYSYGDYRRWVHPKLPSLREKLVPALISVIPCVLMNTGLVLYYTITSHHFRGVWPPEIMLQELKSSAFYLWNWRFSTGDS